MESNYKLEGSSPPARASSLKGRGAFKNSVPRLAPPGSLTPIPEVVNTNWGSSVYETELESLNQNQGGPSSKQSAHWESLLDPVSEPFPNQKRISPVESPTGTVHGFEWPTSHPSPPNDNLSTQHHQTEEAAIVKTNSKSSGAQSVVQNEYDPQNALGIFKAVNWNPSPPPQQKTFEPSQNPPYVQNDGENQRSNHGEQTNQVAQEQAAQEEEVPPVQAPAQAQAQAQALGRGKRVKKWIKRQRDKLRDCLPSRWKGDLKGSQIGP